MIRAPSARLETVSPIAEDEPRLTVTGYHPRHDVSRHQLFCEIHLLPSSSPPPESSTPKLERPSGMPPESGTGVWSRLPFLDDFGMVWSHLGWRFFVLVGLGIVEAILEGLGILMFIPLLEVAGFASEQGVGGAVANGTAARMLASATGALDLGGVLLVIAGLFAFKGVVAFVSTAYRNLTLHEFGFRARTEFLELVGRADYPVLVGQGPRLAHEMATELAQVIRALHTYTFAFSLLLKVIMLAASAFFLAPEIGVFFLVLAASSTWLVRRIIDRSQSASQESSKRLANYSIRVAEAVRSVKFLRATGRFEAMKDRVTQDARASLSVGRRQGMLAALQRAVQEPLVVATMCGVLYLAHQVFSLELSILVASLLFLYRCVMELDLFQMNWQVYSQVRGSIQILETRKGQLLAAQRPAVSASNEDGGYERVFGDASPCLKVSALSYRYSDQSRRAYRSNDGNGTEREVLRRLDWTVEPGSFVAVVGESGAGKTTLLDVMAGLLPPSEGSVVVAGVAIDDTNIGALRTGLGYVTQNPLVFQGTVAENLRLGNGNVSQQRIEDAARDAHCDEFIRNLPAGYDTIVGEEGQPLSGGQSQLLAIARELVRRPRLLLLDEPTSALDAESEDRIQRTLEELRGQVTLVVVSHRLATVRKADRIAFLDCGRLVEEGTFAELRGREDSRFRRFCDLQGVL